MIKPGSECLQFRLKFNLSCLPKLNEASFMSGYKVNILYIELEIFLPYSQSLKDKRRVTRRLKDGLRSHFNLAIAEIGLLDQWQRIAMGITLIGTNPRQLEELQSSIQNWIRERLDGELTLFCTDWL